jgi:drug/metabolite transporter (DMT)-like permease
MTLQTARGPSFPANATIATLAIVVASVGFGLVPLFARSLIEAGMALSAIALCRYAFTAILLLPIARRPRRSGAAALWAGGAGLALGIGWIGYVQALRVAPVATAGVIYMSYPLFALVFAWALSGQRPGLRSVLGGALILTAAILALSPGTLSRAAIHALLLSLVAPITFGAAIAILTGKLQSLSPLERVFFACLGSTIGLLPLALAVDPGSILPTDLAQVLLILGIAIVTAFIPQWLYVNAAPVVGAARAAMAGSVELPTMFVVGWLAFGEAITPLQIAAGVLVVMAILLTPPIAPPAAVAPAIAPSIDDNDAEIR